MEKIIAFILDNWKLIVFGFCTLCNLVLLFVRKRPIKVVDGIKDRIWSILPALINKAEEQFPDHGKGAEKGQFVLGMVWKMLSDEYGISDLDIYSDFIKSAVEYILSTPQKKGD